MPKAFGFLARGLGHVGSAVAPFGFFSYGDDMHPGEILNEDFLKPLRITPQRLANHIGVDVSVIESVIAGEAPINADLSIRLGQTFGADVRWFYNMQTSHDFAVEAAKPRASIPKLSKKRRLIERLIAEASTWHDVSDTLSQEDKDAGAAALFMRGFSLHRPGKPIIEVIYKLFKFESGDAMFLAYRGKRKVRVSSCDEPIVLSLLSAVEAAQ